MKVLVIGDVMLDKYIMGEYARKSPEADVPIIRVPRGGNKSMLGGAANVARACKILGAKSVTIWGNVGKDEGGAQILLKLRSAGINTAGLMAGLERTIIKTRVMDGLQQICRIDEEDIGVDVKYNPRQMECLYNLAHDADRIVLSDYNKGTITEQLVGTLEIFMDKVYVDPKPSHKALYHGCKLIKPNASELYLMAPASTYAESVRILRDELLCDVVATLGAGGAIYMASDAMTSTHQTGNAVEVVDTIGAGDVFMAALAVSNKRLRDAVIDANRIAALSTTQPFTYCPNE